MKDEHLQVLFLGWDDVPRSGEPGAPASLALAQQLTQHATVAVIVPHLAAGAELSAGASLTGLGNFSAEQLEAAAPLPARSAQEWQSPAAPYVGGSSQVSSTSKTDQNQVAPTSAVPASAAGAVGSDSRTITAEAAPTPGAAEPSTAFAEALASLQPEQAAGDLNFRVIQYARFATRLAATQSFGLIYAADWPTWLAGLEIRQRTGKPLVLHVTSLATDRNTLADRGWVLELERLVLRRADAVLAATEALAEQLTSLYGLTPKRLRVVPAGADTAQLAAEVLRTLQETTTA
ncbi:glycosyltransferase [Hymenobacter sp. BT175]|uniref:glycosyltransferase family 4 protein n=1 Tax=Hymenobacter translucens TaxID=2886507 RepID=UPI001D0E6CCA|nr:glycosyltransferase family 4 protein [Hymenobacter translucens]MCC2547153.1 glycosyltransferase [Hymenobacter translucens]